MADLGTSPNTVTVRDARRSTRISESVRVSVSGQSKVGSAFSELTLTLAVNCHGCIYPSRNEHRTGSWVTLQFPNQQSDPKSPPVRAQVKFVRPPRSPEEHYQVGVELEAPANVWKVESTPKDWHRFPVLISGAASTVPATTPPAGPEILGLHHVPTATAEPVRQTPTTTADSSKPNGAAFSAEQFLRTLEHNLQQTAEKAVASALTSQLNSRVNQAITAMEKFSQASVRQVEEYCTRSQEKLISSARDEVLRRLQADLTQAEERLQKQLDAALTKIQETSRGVVKDAASQAHLVLAESVDFLKDTAREFQGQYSTQLRETTDRTAAELSAETVRFSDRQFALLAKQAQVAIGEGSTVLERHAAEAHSQLETAAGKMLDDFHQRANIEIDQAASKVHQDFKSSLTSIADEIRENWEARQRAWQDEVAQSSEQNSEQFRQRLETILRSSMVTAISAVNEQSRALLSSMSKEAEEQLREVTHSPMSS
jgi:hypothetical protein